MKKTYCMLLTVLFACAMLFVLPVTASAAPLSVNYNAGTLQDAINAATGDGTSIAYSSITELAITGTAQITQTDGMFLNN